MHNPYAFCGTPYASNASSRVCILCRSTIGSASRWSSSVRKTPRDSLSDADGDDDEEEGDDDDDGAGDVDDDDDDGDGDDDGDDDADGDDDLMVMMIEEGR